MRELNSKIRHELNVRGLKATPQRLAVLDAIAGTEGYFTPQELYESLKEQSSSIGLVTIYRTLSMLAGAGLVCQIESPGKARCYVRRKPLSHHHHLVCGGCARVVDFGDCDLSDLTDRLTRETGFIISGHSLEFHGMCRDCVSRTQVPDIKRDIEER